MMTTVFGANELALRAFPLICSIFALFLLWRVATRLLPAATIPLAIAPLAIAPFALAPPLIFFAAEAKQYSSDIAIAIGLLLLALELETREPPRGASWWLQPQEWRPCGFHSPRCSWRPVSASRSSCPR
jgi:uncharacterized membrane protein